MAGRPRGSQMHAPSWDFNPEGVRQRCQALLGDDLCRAGGSGEGVAKLMWQES